MKTLFILAGVILTPTLLILLAMLVSTPSEIEIITVIGHIDDHEVLLSNGTSMFVEHIYCDSFAIGSTISFMPTKKVKR